MMWVAFEILGFWVALALLTAIVCGIVVQGWAPYWRNIRSLFRHNPPLNEYGDLSEGR